MKAVFLVALMILALVAAYSSVEKMRFLDKDTVMLEARQLLFYEGNVDKVVSLLEQYDINNLEFSQSYLADSESIRMIADYMGVSVLEARYFVLNQKKRVHQPITKQEFEQIPVGEPYFHPVQKMFHVKH
jgi:hypothetical protein